MTKDRIPWKLMLAHLKNEESTQDKIDFQQWLLKSENLTLYVEIESLWNQIQQTVGLYVPDVDYYWRKLSEKIDNHQQKNQISYIWKYIAIAASVLLIIGVATFSYYVGRASYLDNIPTQQLATTGSKSDITLPDGTKVTLNRESTISYNQRAGKRNVQLSGEAFFEVAKDVKHPFIVSLKNIAVKVYGTKFNVRAYAKDSVDFISLVEGHISVMKDGKELDMQPGYMVTYNKQNKHLQLQKADLSMNTVWRRKSLSFNNKPMSEICKYLEKWYDVKIDIEPEITNSSYTFTIHDESIESILQNMSLINNIVYYIDEDHITITNLKKK